MDVGEREFRKQPATGLFAKLTQYVRETQSRPKPLVATGGFGRFRSASAVHQAVAWTMPVASGPRRSEIGCEAATARRTLTSLDVAGPQRRGQRA